MDYPIGKSVGQVRTEARLDKWMMQSGTFSDDDDPPPPAH